MAAPTTHDWMDLEVVSATNLRNHINAPINYGIGRDIGSDDAIELEDSLALPAGAFFLGLPTGTTGQRPAAGEGRFRWNTTTGLPEMHDGSSWRGLLDVEAVTFGNLNAAGDVGNLATQVPRGDHVHTFGLQGYGYSAPLVLNLGPVADWADVDSNLVFATGNVAINYSGLAIVIFHLVSLLITLGTTTEFRLVDGNNADAVVVSSLGSISPTDLTINFNGSASIPANASLKLQHRRTQGVAGSSYRVPEVLLAIFEYGTS